MKRFFGNRNMSWPAVILFAAAAGIYTGAVMQIDALAGTSFQDIGTYFEWWVIFAVIVVVNCQKGTEAALKCFVFFLISQPLVYAVEVLFGSLAPDLALYYYRTIWFPRTLLTLPGGFIAYHCKDQTVPGAVILGLGNTIQTVMGVFYLAQAALSFPHHFLSALVCFGSVFVMTGSLQKDSRRRLIAILVPLVLTIALILLLRLSGRTLL